MWLLWMYLLIRSAYAASGGECNPKGFKDAACRVIRDAYLKASANNTLPANARQIYYGARPAILALTRRSQLDDHYFRVLG